MIHLKVNFADQQLGYLYPSELSDVNLEELFKFIKDRQQGKEKHYSIEYCDLEKDYISICTEEDLIIMKEYAKTKDSNLFELIIQDETNKSYIEKLPLQKPRHEDVVCNRCSMYPIVGTRYRSLVLSDFDLCERCEQEFVHPYPLIKILSPDQNKYLSVTNQGVFKRIKDRSFEMISTVSDLVTRWRNQLKQKQILKTIKKHLNYQNKNKQKTDQETQK